MASALVARKRLLSAMLVGASAFALTGCQAPCRCADQMAAPRGHRMLGQLPSFSSPGTATEMTATPGTSRRVGLFTDPSAPEGVDGGFTQQASLTQVSFAPVGSDFDPALDASGAWLAFASTQHAATSDIYRKTVDGRTMVRLTSDPADDAMPAWSPDGESIAFASNRSGSWDLWIMSRDGGQPTQLTANADHELHPTFSPDGRTIAYSRQNGRSGRWEIWAFDLNRPGAHAYVCDGLFPQWSPEPGSRTLLFQSPRERGSRYFGIWTIEFTGGRASSPTQIVASTDAAVMHPAWSPDGSSICFCTVLDPESDISWLEQSDVWVIGADGTGRTPLTSGRFRNMQPTWAGDGRIYFVSDRTGQDTVWSVPAPTTEDEFGLGILAIFEDDPSK